MDGLLPKLRKTAPALLLIVTLAFLLTFSLLAGKRPAEVSAGADQTAAKRITSGMWNSTSPIRRWKRR